VISRLRAHGFVSGIERRDSLGTRVFAEQNLPADHQRLASATRQIMAVLRIERTTVLRAESPPGACKGTFAR
jgi:hypothetical protein